VPFTERPELVRGLDYYTGAIFEVSHPALGSQDALAAGGRYDGLSLRMGGADVGATGYAIGVERLLLAFPEDIQLKMEPGVFVIPVEEKDKGEAFRVAGRLRSAEIKCDMDLNSRSMKARMRKAGKENRAFVVFVAKRSAAEPEISVKDMSTGEQKDNISFIDLIETIRKEKGEYDKDA
jgi:histidyl-tRNA synthetase